MVRKFEWCEDSGVEIVDFSCSLPIAVECPDYVNLILLLVLSVILGEIFSDGASTWMYFMNSASL